MRIRGWLAQIFLISMIRTSWATVMLGKDRLGNLIAIFNDPALNFSANRAEHDDILGDAYEYLMRHFATQSGKSKGQFYTPAEVSRVRRPGTLAGSTPTRSPDTKGSDCRQGHVPEY
jgi:type I restriction enzyme M protein